MSIADVGIARQFLELNTASYGLSVVVTSWKIYAHSLKSATAGTGLPCVLVVHLCAPVKKDVTATLLALSHRRVREARIVESRIGVGWWVVIQSPREWIVHLSK